jgi:hydroxyethylthiazole kinase-like uncharacterized protein yjeF
VIPVVTPEQMADVDRSAPEPVDVLVERAGFAVARAARRRLGGAYGRRITVVAGPGNNGADGRVAARWLEAWGARVAVVDARAIGPAQHLGPADLVVDGAFGTGLSRPYDPPDTAGSAVLAVDIPSGLSGLTGLGSSLSAELTVTFGALKPGLLLGHGPDRCGTVELVGLGLTSRAEALASRWLVEDADLHALPRRPRQGHKWQTAVLVVGGSASMNGAPLMVAHGAMRAGAGYALVGVPGAPEGGGLPPGAHVGLTLPASDWAAAAAEAAQRVKAVVVGPGLGPQARSANGDSGPESPVAYLLASTGVPVVVDADGLNGLGDVATLRAVASGRAAPVVITPHEGEFARLTGHPPGEDRIADVVAVAAATGCVVLLKGSPTVVAGPDGQVRIAAAGTPRLATAGTGDVLSGVLAAFLARGLGPLDAAALAAHAHGRAAARGRSEGLVATDLPELVADFLSTAVPERPPRADG